MHREAFDWTYTSFHIWKNVQIKKTYDILEIGSFNINGGVREMFAPWAVSYVGIDPQEGPGVDIVISATEYIEPSAYDIIVTNETFEHTPDWKEIVENCYTNLRNGGLFTATMAGEGRPPHSALDTGEIREWEHYANIGAWDLNQTLVRCGFKNIVVDKLHTDLRCSATK